ncbi:DNA methyltransferase [Pseudonocardia sp. NPDC049635]|uniref:site-specific DNA-methyltransferase n=1 Tax=Pseudonocardia sp. NPDC049635 TaxID=3155506 RepID=UPI0033E14327
MSSLSNLLRAVEATDPQLAADLAKEIKALSERRAFGLNFERHTPETVELPGRSVRRGDKVRFLAPRGADPKSTDERLWQVTNLSMTSDGQVAALARRVSPDSDEVETATRPCEDLVVVAEFRDPIYAGLASTGKVERGGDKPFHTVINAENFHALQTLLYTHEGKVDAIYIDPPYNSGARDWKYNNNYVDGDDLYRHSKWLAFMERRLKLAKQLLNPARSVLIVAIDENEVHRLALLLQQLFTGSKIQMVTALINPAGASIIDQFSRVDEHLLFVHVGAARPARTIVDTTPGTSTFVSEDGAAKPFTWEAFQRSGGNSRREDTKAKFFPVYIDEESETIVGCGEHLPLGVPLSDAPPPPDGCISQWPIKSDGSEACWQLSAPTFREYLAAGRIKIGRLNRRTGRYGLSFLTSGHMRAIAAGELVTEGRNAKGELVVKNAEGRARSQVGKTMWTNGAYSATEHGSTLLRKFLPNRKFPFPKSLYAVEDALRFYIGDNRNAVVLDFFGGSGTTTHAVMRLNRQDDGARKSIVVTNNEVNDQAASLRAKGLRPGDPDWEQFGICEYFTKPRLQAAVTGVDYRGETMNGTYRFVDEFPIAEGFEENIEFFTMTYENPRAVAHNRSFQAIAPLLWLRAGAEGSRIEHAAEDFAVADTYGVLFDLDSSGAFLAALADGKRVRAAFIVTDDDRAFQMICSELPPHVEAIRLYDSYMANFVINTGRE